MWRSDIGQHPQFGIWYRRVQTQPSWVVKASLTLAALVVIVPLVMLALAALVVGVAAFLVLGVIANVVQAFQAAFGTSAGPAPMPRDSGRINVRVIDER